MSDLEVRDGEYGVVRVVALGPGPGEPGPEDVALALGVDRLDPDQVDIVTPGDLAGVGLAGYLTEGMGVEGAQADAARLDGIEGPVAVVRSAAFDGPQTLALAPGATLVGVYREAQGAGAVPEPMGAEPDAPISPEVPLAPGPETPGWRPPRGIVMMALAAAALVVLIVGLLGGGGS